MALSPATGPAGHDQPAGAGTPLLRTADLRLGDRLQGVSLTLHPGELLGIIGPNGAGKSSLLGCLAGILAPTAGQLWLAGQPLAGLAPLQRARQLGYLLQRGESSWALAVRDVVTLGRLPWQDEDAAAIAAAMATVGVSELAGRRIDRLSGGEQARVWLARVLAGRPQVLLADEPTASLDLYHERAVMRCLREHATADRATVLALHDLPLAARYCDRLCLLEHGRVRALGRPRAVLTEAHLSAVYQVPVRVDLDAEPPVVAPR